MAIALLKRSPLLRALPGNKLAQVLRFARMKTVPAGTLIFNKTDLASHMFIVAAGRVKIYSRSATRKAKTFAYLGPGDFFGEMALLDAHQRSASAQAVKDSELLVIHKRDFKRFLLSDPGLCLSLLRTLCERLRRSNEQIESLLFQNVLGRVSRALCDLAREEGRRFRGGLLIQSPYTRQELADLVGTTREPLSRALASLQRAQFIKFHHGLIHLRNTQRMQSLAATCVE
jgi:CRP-like cAMP-binding protein